MPVFVKNISGRTITIMTHPEDTARDVIDHFSRGKNCEIMTMTTLEKDSVSKIKAKLLSYVS